MKKVRQSLAGICIAAVILCSWLAPLDEPATKQVDAGLKNALVTFATARTLNGVVSALQGTQVATQPFGVGITFTPGQLLSPANEVLKHFSDLMLAASIAFGIQKVLIGIGAFWLVSLALTVVALAWAWSSFRLEQPPRWLAKGLVVLVMVRFAIPAVAIGTDMLVQRFLAADYEASQQAIALSSSQLATLNPPVPSSAEGSGILDRMKDLLPKGMDVKARFERLKDAAEQATTHVVNIMVIFLLQTLIIPLLLLWGLYGIARAVIVWPSGVSARVGNR